MLIDWADIEIRGEGPASAEANDAEGAAETAKVEV